MIAAYEGRLIPLEQALGLYVPVPQRVASPFVASVVSWADLEKLIAQEMTSNPSSLSVLGTLSGADISSLALPNCNAQAPCLADFDFTLTLPSR